VADTYEAETRQTLQRLLAALVPGVTIILAVLVAVVVMAVLVPLYDLTTIAGA
jgi:general secretion pathway protein F